MNKRYIVDVLLTTIGFAGLLIWGANPYTNFLFVLCMFFGSPIVRRRNQTKAKIDVKGELIRGGRFLAFIGAGFAAGWIVGEEYFLRIIHDFRFLGPVWLWVQLVLVEEHFMPKVRVADI